MFAYEEALRKEWVLGNGLGGYASSTTIGCNTRRYHGLLVAAIENPSEKAVLLSKLEETVKVGDNEYPLSTNKYPGVLHPKGCEFQTGFDFNGEYAKFEYEIEGGKTKIQKYVRALHGRNATLVTYEIAAPKSIALSFRPLLALRDFHSLAYSTAPRIIASANGFQAAGEFPLFLEAEGAKFLHSEQTYYNFVYEWESLRGYPEKENLFSPGYFEAKVKAGTIRILASTGKNNLPALAELEKENDARAEMLLQEFYSMRKLPRSKFLDALVLAADSFLVQREGLHSILAGYHWFEDWGRDAMIALPGILLTTGRYAYAKSVLRLFGKHMRDGVIPNRFRMRHPEYNTADASLWFVHAAYAYAKETKDFEFVQKELWPRMQEVIEGYVEGTNGVQLEQDGLLSTTKPGLTWMDTRFTHRIGKPVEINALWYSSLKIIRALAEHFGEDAQRYRELAEKSLEAFACFWNPKLKCLYDLLSPNDASIRPNQLFAVSLPFSPLPRDRQQQVFECVRMHLYTPLGLRSLAPADARFHSSYSGSEEERDAAYHNGAIWPWLIGSFIDAFVRVYPERRKEVLKFLAPFEHTMQEGGIGSISELFDPATLLPAGCISQAWSVGEILRCYVVYQH